MRLQEVNSSPVVEQLCRALGAGKVPQNIAQAAAWNVANGLSWQELINKPRVVSQYTGVEMYFSRFEIENAMKLVSMASHQADLEQSAARTTESEAQETSIGDKLSTQEVK